MTKSEIRTLVLDMLEELILSSQNSEYIERPNGREDKEIDTFDFRYFRLKLKEMRENK